MKYLQIPFTHISYLPHLIHCVNTNLLVIYSFYFVFIFFCNNTLKLFRLFCPKIWHYILFIFFLRMMVLYFMKDLERYVDFQIIICLNLWFPYNFICFPFHLFIFLAPRIFFSRIQRKRIF